MDQIPLNDSVHRLDDINWQQNSFKIITAIYTYTDIASKCSTQSRDRTTVTAGRLRNYSLKKRKWQYAFRIRTKNFNVNHNVTALCRAQQDHRNYWGIRETVINERSMILRW